MVKQRPVVYLWEQVSKEESGHGKSLVLKSFLCNILSSCSAECLTSQHIHVADTQVRVTAGQKGTQVDTGMCLDGGGVEGMLSISGKTITMGKAQV